MKRDMDLIRKIMLRIEEEYTSTAIFNLKVDGYTMEQIAIHCKMMYEAGLISDYKAQYAGNHYTVLALAILLGKGMSI